MKLTANTKVVDVMNLPEFAGFGQFIFPTEWRFPKNLTLDRVDYLLPYHSNIRLDTTINVIEEMRKRVNQGETIFYDIYSEEEKRFNPSKEETGLFYFKGKKNAPFAIINAGGGFSYVGSIHESFPHAIELSKRGYNAFALQYRTGGANCACEDLAAAICFIFEHKEELGVDTSCYSLWGGSAGARMAAYLGSYGTERFTNAVAPRAGCIVMQYTGHSQYSRNDPPTYACVGLRDGIADWRVMKRRIDSMAQCGIDTDFHSYPHIGHGFGLGIGTTADGWINEAIAFWERQMKKSGGN